MSTILKVIDRVDQGKPNAFSTAAKVAWLAALDGRIAVDVFLMDIAELEQFAYRYPEDVERELLVSFPHDDIYDLWLAARIDFENGEYDKYQNTMAMYNEHYASFVQWFTRTYEPARGGGFRHCGNMPSYYITAYALAVKQGFEGDEAAWLASLHGREVEFQCQKYMLQWRRATSETQKEEAWKDLVDVASVLVDHDAIAELVREDLQKKIAPKAGFIYPLASGAVPEGFLLCDGAEYDREEYPELFAAIGTIYGEGNGNTTFNVPNLATRVPVGSGEGYEIGATGGEAEHVLTVAQIPSVGVNVFREKASTGDWAFYADFTQVNIGSTCAGTFRSENQPVDNMQPYTVVNYIIATGKDTAVSVADIVLGTQAIPLEVQYGGTGASNPADARKKLGITPENIGAIPRSGGTMTGALEMDGHDIYDVGHILPTFLNGVQIEGFKSGKNNGNHALDKYGTSVYLFLGYCNGIGACAYVVSSRQEDDAVDVHKIAGGEYASISFYADDTEQLKFILLPYSSCLVIRIGMWHTKELG